MNIFRTPETPRPIHLDFPMALVTMDLSATEMLVYMLLLNRSNLSARGGDWVDGRGHVFVWYPIHSLAEALGRSEAGVKKALNGLEKKGLIARRQQGWGKPTCIYVKLPQGKEDCPAEGKKAVRQGVSKLPVRGQENCLPRQAESLPSMVYESSP